MFLLLRHGVACLHAQLTLRHGEVLELLTVLGFLQQLLAFSIIELDASALLIDDSFHVLCFYNHLVTVFTNRVATFHWCHLWHNHQRGRFLRQLCLRRSPDADDVVVNHFETNHLGLSVVRSNRHLSTLGLHDSSRRHAGHHQCRYHHTNSLHFI